MNNQAMALPATAAPSAAAPFDFQPELRGTTIVLRPLRADDFEALYAVAADPLIWEQHPDALRYQRDVFMRFFNAAMASASAFAVLDLVTEKMMGSSRYYEWAPEKGEVAIGYTFLDRSHWGGQTNREMKALMLAHAFRWASRVWFHIGEANLRSRKAIEKIGATLSHCGGKEMNGCIHPYTFYSIESRHQNHPQSI